MKNIEYLYKSVERHIQNENENVNWRYLALEYIKSSSESWETMYEPRTFNITYSSSSGNSSSTRYTKGMYPAKKSNQPRLPESYPRENLDMLFGVEGG